jgi:hypothetical protein
VHEGPIELMREKEVSAETGGSNGMRNRDETIVFTLRCARRDGAQRIDAWLAIVMDLYNASLKAKMDNSR